MSILAALALAADSPAVALIACGAEVGTAYWIDRERIITAAHVVAAGPCVVRGRLARVVRVDHARDVAELTGAESDAWLEVDCGGFRRQSPYLAVGYTGGRRHSAAVRATRARRDNGTVRRLTWFHGYVYHGMSGGPLLNTEGQASGVVSSIGAPGDLGESSRDSFHRPLSETFLCERT